MAIGIFDSGYGGLTILKEIRKRLPEYDYLYLGDNARAPYGTRSFDVVYHYTLQAVEELFRRGCHLVILACNTASAKALRTIQQNDLKRIDPSRRVLGVIRPTVEALPNSSKSGHVGLLATEGTVLSHSYAIELGKMAPDMFIVEHACPMWVPLIENNEGNKPGADYFIKKDIEELLEQDPEIDTIVLGCTHYPIILEKIKQFTQNAKVISQGKIVAESLSDYFIRHPEIETKCSKNGTVLYLTTEDSHKFNNMASNFIGDEVESRHIDLPVSNSTAKDPSLIEKIKTETPEEAVKMLDAYITLYPEDEEAYTLRGLRHWALGHRALAIKDYLAAIAINPESKAKMALKAANDILDYYNKDLLNP